MRKKLDIDEVDYRSGAYRAGTYAGQAVNIGLMVANPLAGGKAALGFFSRSVSALGAGTRFQQVAAIGQVGLQYTQAIGGAAHLGQAVGQVVNKAQAGEAIGFSDVLGIAMSTAGMALPMLRGRNPCSWGSTVAAVGQRSLHVVGAAGDAWSAGTRLAQGDVLGGLLDLGQVAANLFLARQPCFPAEMPIRTSEGSIRAASIEEGDYVLSRSELDPNGPLAYKRVEEKFVRLGYIWRFLVGGQWIRTTCNHPFYARGKGWAALQELAVGDVVHCEDGQWRRIEAIEDTGAYETVYNFRVADYHTYFVGGVDWGFSVWAHNSCGPEDIRRASGKAGLTDEQLGRATDLLNKRSTRAAMQELDRLGVDVNGVEVRKLLAQNSRYADLRGERPRLSDAQVKKVWDNAKDANGRVFDNTTTPPTELTWGPGSRHSQWQMGHLPEKSYQQLHGRFMSGEISYQQFLGEVRNPANYFPQAPTPNMGRHLERGTN